jgi:GAF domain-containing protein/anti-sigma regulatory factor (Ser/Thr protein kinase)
MDAMSPEASIIGGDQSLEELRRELAEAREQQAAAAEILRVISSSPTDLKRVFTDIATSAARLCDAYDVAIHQVDGDLLPLVAHYGPIPVPASLPLTRGVLAGRAVLDRQTIQLADMQAETDEYPEGSHIARRHGLRTNLAVPLIGMSKAVGVITLRRSEVKPFTERQTELAKTFADQAVIAIKNTRLFEEVQARTKELTQALEQQTATSEVLGVISSSPGELEPVFQTLLENAVRICEAKFGTLYLSEGDGFRAAAMHNAPPGFREERQRGLLRLPQNSSAGRAASTKKVAQIVDIKAEQSYIDGDAFRVTAVELAGFRTVVSVPMLKDDELVGIISIYRQEVRPFSEKQIELVSNFAKQAVIAIENSRLLNELRESLQQQTATADVLKVISRSAFDLQAVLDTLVEAVSRLCEADMAQILRPREESYYVAAKYGFSPEYTEYHKTVTFAPGRGSLTGRVLLEGKPVQIPDVLADAEYNNPEPQRLGGYRTHLGVPLLRGGTQIGVILVSRRTVRPFDNKQIELITTFADQAVIAIENTRLFEEVQARTKELTESLESQTATSDILNVISLSPTDVQPVFDNIAANAVKLCSADRALIYRFDGELLRLAASYNAPPELREFIVRNPFRPGPQSTSARAALERQTVQILDLQADPEYAYGARDVVPIRSTIAVPMLKGEALLGVITIYRLEVRPFTSKQIALVETFADQAAIAISNVGLFDEVQARNTELRVALEQQTATSELLKVIGRSTFDLQPVFETLAENAVRLCEAEHALIFRYDGQHLRIVASHNIPPGLKAFVEANPTRPGRGSAVGRAASERRTIHIEDIRADPEFTYGVVHAGPMRTVLAIPMLRADELLGVIVITRPDVRLFTHRQIALVETFADQAVIAIANTRLFDEVQARNRDLTALGEVGRAVSSTLDLKVVLKSIVDRAVELSGTDGGSIFYYRGGCFELGETTGLNEEAIARFRKLDIAEGQTGLGEAIAQRQPLQVPDIFQRPSNPLRDAAIEAGLRAGLIVPLFGGEGPLGALVLQRRRPGQFPPTVVRLMQSFADQSAIALENARLFNEIAQKSRELEIASQHKSQFVANMSHELRTPLAAILGYAELMQEGFYEPLGQKSLVVLTRIRSNGKHLLGLINTVLDIAKIESGQFTLNMSEYAIESVVETVRSATESLAQNKKLALKTEVAKSLPIGVGDEQRLTQVLLNLVGNAIKFTDAGEVRVTAKAIDGHFAVTVADTGPGIPAEHQTRIFDQFHQVDSSNTKAKAGTGLGLAIAKQIVEMHGGRIRVESTLGKGSTFQMEIPARAKVARSG